MDKRIRDKVTDSLSNVVENVACRIAEQGNGRVTPMQVLPYLPMSLELVQVCLDGMVDETAVIRDDEAELVEYVFTAYRGDGSAGIPSEDACVACGKDLPEAAGGVLCGECRARMRRELTTLAETFGWPAQAVYEHEIAYLASKQPRAAHAEDLSGRSRYTLRSMRRKLDRLSADGYIRQELDADSGLISYHLPEMAYPKDEFRANMAVIRSYPASYQEELEIKVVRVFVALAILFLLMFVLAFMRVPYPILVFGFVVTAPVVALSILRRRSPVIDE